MKAGFVLPAMLSLTVLLALVLAGVLQAAREAHDGALDMTRRTTAFYLAEAGIARGSIAITDAIAERQTAPATQRFSVEGRDITVVISDLRSRFDLNASPPEELKDLFARLGASAGDAKTLADELSRAREPVALTGLRDTRLEGLLPQATVACLETHLSAHGGTTTKANAFERGPADFGAAFEITATTPLVREQVAEVRAVVRATGDPEHPFLTHEWRRRIRTSSTPADSCWRGST